MKKSVSGNARGLVLFIVIIVLIFASSQGVQSKKNADDYRIQIIDSDWYYSSPYEGVLEYYSGDNISMAMIIEMTKHNDKPVTIPYKMKLYTLDAEKMTDISGNSRLEDKEKCLPAEPSRIIKGKLKFDKFKNSQRKFEKLIDFKPSLGKLKPGYYWLAIDFGKARKAIAFHVSQSALIVKSTEDEVLVFAQDKKTGKAIPGMEVSLMMDDDFHKLGETGEDGVFRFKKTDLPPVSKERLLFIKAAKGNDVTICRIVFRTISPIYIGYIYTDRPIYRPGQTVHFKAVIREKRGNKLKCVPGKEFEVLVPNYETGDNIYKKKLKADEFGNINDSFQLGEKSKLGEFRILVGEEYQPLANCSFRVEEYRKPEYEITVKPLSKSVVRGDKARFEVDARYYFGKPLANADFTYEFEDQYSYNDEYRDYYSLNWPEIYSPTIYKYRKNSEEESEPEDKVFHGKTDKNGKALIEFKTPKEYPQILSVTVKMMDSSRRPVLGSAYINVAKAAFTITANTNRKFYPSGSPVNISIKTADPSGKPVSKKVNLEIVKPLKFKKKDGEASYRKFTLLKKTIVTDKKGSYTFKYSPKGKTGFFQILASSIDSRGNKVNAYHEFIRAWKTGNGNYYGWEKLIPARDTYKAGDRVEVLFIKPDSLKDRKNADILLTLETDKVSTHKIVKINDATGIISFNAVKDFSPGVDLNLSCIGNSEFCRANRGITIDSNQRNLTIKLARDKNKYKPGENAVFKIQALKEEDNSPASCEVSLGVADESVFALAENTNDNICDFFNKKDPYCYYFRRSYSPFIDTFNSIMVTEQFRGLKPGFIDPVFGKLADGGYNKVKTLYRIKVDTTLNRVVSSNSRIKTPPPPPPPTIRQHFPDTCYFNPQIITDEKGEAVVHVKLPDSLTTWRATVVGDSKDNRFGQAEEKIIVAKDLLVRLIMPRFLVEKDETSVMGIVHNYLDKPVEAQVSLEAEGVEFLSTPAVKAMIEPGDKTLVEWKVRAGKPGEGKFTVKALTSMESDAVLLKIPLLAHGYRNVDAKAGSTDDKLALTFNLKEKASVESAELKINLSPSLAGSLMGALDYLTAYPYGCVEQTMSSFIPNAIVQATLKKLGIRDEKLEKKLPDMMKEGFKKIYDYQRADGGWGWWENDKTDPMMTALVVYGLSLADKAGYKVDKKRLGKGTAKLKNLLAGVKDPDKRVFILYALSENSVQMEAPVNRLYNNYNKLGNYSRALLAITLYKNGQKERAKKVLRSLEKRAVKHKTIAYWKGSGNYAWDDNTVEITAYSLQAFLLIEPENPIVEKAVRYLASSRRGEYWCSTKDTAAAVLAVMEYAKRTKEMNPEFEASLYLNGKKLKDIKFTKKDIASGGLTLTIPGKELKSGENTVTVEKSGKGKAYLSGVLTSYLKTDRAKPYNNGFIVRRKYYLVTRRTEDETKAEIARRKREEMRGYYGEYGNPAEKLIPLNEKEQIKLKPQDVVEVSLYLEARPGMEYIMLEDMKPAGCEFVEDKEASYNWEARREFRDDRAVFFMNNLWSSSKVFRYRLRAETPGTYRTLPARAELMYFPDVSGASGEFIVQVKK